MLNSCNSSPLAGLTLFYCKLQGKPWGFPSQRYKPSAKMPKKVVISIDNSVVSKDALTWASKSLVRPEDELHVITVLEPVMRSDFSSSAESGLAYEGSEGCKPDPIALERSQKLLVDTREDLNKQGIKNVKLTTLVSCVGGANDIGRHISDYAEQNSADMLVMGSRGLGTARRTMLGLFGLGSISDYVVKNAPCNVVVHKMQAKPTA